MPGGAWRVDALEEALGEGPCVRQHALMAFGPRGAALPSGQELV